MIGLAPPSAWAARFCPKTNQSVPTPPALASPPTLQPSNFAGGVHIDGSLLEGGGQILRNASALAAILRRPLKVDRIRAGRDKPGGEIGR